MILDRAADLERLAAQAESTATATSDANSYEQVAERINAARSLLEPCGVSFFLTWPAIAEERAKVASSARALVGALEVLERAGDTEIAALASGAADERGSLTAVSRLAVEVRQRALEAQLALLGSWANEICDEAMITRLDLLSHISEQEVTASRALRIRSRILGAAEDGPAMSRAELAAVEADKQTARTDVDKIAAVEVPDDVATFWGEAATPTGVTLEALTKPILLWLAAHDALAALQVRRSE